MSIVHADEPPLSPDEAKAMAREWDAAAFRRRVMILAPHIEAVLSECVEDLWDTFDDEHIRNAVRRGSPNAPVVRLDALLREIRGGDPKCDLPRAAAPELGPVRGICSWCGLELYGDHDPVGRIKDHLLHCSLHPMRKVERERDQLRQAIRDIAAACRQDEASHLPRVSAALSAAGED